MTHLEILMSFTLFLFIVLAAVGGRASSIFIDSFFELKEKINKPKTALKYALSHVIPLMFFLLYFLWFAGGQFSDADKDFILSDIDGFLTAFKWLINGSFIIAMAACLFNMIKGIWRIIFYKSVNEEGGKNAR